MNDPYHVYMDLDVINTDYNATSKPQLRFEENRNTPFLPGDSGDYFCSVVRFSIQTANTLPVFVPRVRTGQSDVNKTIYQVAIMYDSEEEENTSSDKIGFASVMYTPEDETIALPAAPVASQDFSSSYYHVYNYQHFVHLVNTAIQTAWGNLRTALTAVTFDALVGNTLVPWIDFDPGTNRMFLNADDKLFNSERTLPSNDRLKLILTTGCASQLPAFPFA